MCAACVCLLLVYMFVSANNVIRSEFFARRRRTFFSFIYINMFLKAARWQPVRQWSMWYVQAYSSRSLPYHWEMKSRAAAAFLGYHNAHCAPSNSKPNWWTVRFLCFAPILATIVDTVKNTFCFRKKNNIIPNFISRPFHMVWLWIWWPVMCATQWQSHINNKKRCVNFECAENHKKNKKRKEFHFYEF